jgi:HK97 family phage prohead protease
MTVTQPSPADLEQLTPTRGLARVAREYAAAGVEVRAESDGSTKVNFSGHASVTDKGYDMYGGPGSAMGGWTEYVDSGAFKRTLSQNPDVAFLINHEGMTLARTKSKTLTLREDTVGLAVKATLDTRDTNVNNAVVQMEAGNLDEMSFAFRIVRQQWLNADGEEVPWWDLSGIERHIQEVNIHKGDVSLVNYGANPFTAANLRALADMIRPAPADRFVQADVRAAITLLQARVQTPAEGEIEAADVAAIETAVRARQHAFNAKHTL